MSRPEAMLWRVALVVAVVCLLPAACNAQLSSESWPKFRGNAANTGLSPQSGPSAEMLSWTFSTGGAISSSAAVTSAGIAHISSQDGYLYAINDDGTQRWRYRTYSINGSSPAIAADGTVYVGSSDRYLYAVRPTGTLKWRKSLGSVVQSSPAIGADGTVYIGTMNGKLYAISPSSTTLWTYTTNSILSSPAVGPDGAVYFSAYGSYIYCLNSSGTLRWKYYINSYSESSPAIGGDGRVYCGSDGGVLYALNAAGELEWSYSAGSAIKSSPGLGPDGSVYFGCDDGYLYALTPEGTLKWRYSTGSAVRSSPAIGADGIVYVGSSNHYLHAVRPDGTLKWSSSLGGTVTGSPAISSGGNLYIGSGSGDVFAFARDKTPPTTPVVVDDGAYSTSTTTVHASWSADDPETGIVEYQFAVGTTPGATNLRDWTSAGSDTEATVTGLSIPNGSMVYISVKAFNGAHVWSEVGVSDGMRIDCTPPTSGVVTDGGVYTASTSTLSATWSFTDAESGVARYFYAIGTAPGASDVVVWTDAGLATGITRTQLHLTNGATYYFSVVATNLLGLDSAVVSSDGITVDTTPPATPSVADSGAFTSSTTTLTASWTSSDPQSGIAEYFYAIGSSPGAADVRGWTSTGTSAQVSATGLSLTGGTAYFISVKARNGAGMESAAGSSDGITVDTAPPAAPVVVDDGRYTSSTSTLHATWTAIDDISWIEEYTYAIGTSPGASNVATWTSVGSAEQVTRTGLSLVSGQTYYVSVKARDAAGLWSAAGSSDGITVDSSPPTLPVVTDDGSLTSSATTLHATWLSSDAQSGVEEYEYCIGTTAGGTNVVDWTSNGSASELTRTGLSLVDGSTYYISVRARNGAGLWSAAGSSDGIKVDASPPDPPVVVDDGQFTASTTLHASWSASEPHTAIAEYSYCIGTAPGEADVVAWTSAGTATQVTRVSLPLVGGVTYYFSVKARNTGGLWSQPGVSDGITYDNTAPEPPVVTDDGRYTFSMNTLHATWTAFDDTSGVTEYQYAIGTTPGGANTVYWTNVGPAQEITRTGLSLSNGGTYYISVKARNGAGLWSAVGASDGITVDSTPPAQPIVTDDGVLSSSATSLHATWSSSDAQSGVAEYEFAIGTSPGGTDTVGWTSNGSSAEVTRSDLSLVDGAIYYFSVRARNGAGQWSSVGSSDGIKVDASPPSTPVVVDDGDYTSSTTLHATWSSSDVHTGVADYSYCIGTSPGDDDLVGWTSMGAATAVTRVGLPLVSGQVYYFSVRARSGAGLESEVGTSDGITYDNSAPDQPIVFGDGPYSTSKTWLRGYWFGWDDESGVVEYLYAVGTTPGSANVVAWTSAGLQEDVLLQGLSLIEGGTYYISAKVRNGAGLWGEPGISDPIVVDSIPPTTPVVVDDGAYASSINTLHATWNSSDAGSGLAEFSYAIGTAPGSANVSNWTSTGSVAQVTRTGLTLTPGTTYYFAVKARDKAGSWSAVGVSDGIIPDNTAPGTPAVVDDGDYTSTASQIHATWSAADAESGLAEYQYAVGYSPEASDIVPWASAGTSTEITRTGLALSEGIPIYVSVRARNRVGLWSSIGSSDGIRIDSSPPSTPAVTDEGQYTMSFDSLSASWSSSDLQSGVVEYEYCIGSIPGGVDVRGWTSAGIATQVAAQGLLLTEGSTYYVAVRAKNAAGAWSTAGLSDGITVAPGVAWPRFRYDSSNRGLTRVIGCGAGDLRWEFASNGWLESSPAVAGDGTIYVGCGDGGMYALNRAGSVVWQYMTGDSIDSSPAIGMNGKIYFGSYDGYVYCLHSNGQLSWRYRTGDEVWSSPLIGPDGVIYIGSHDGYMYALNSNGTLKWRYPTPSTVWSSPALGNNGCIYFGGGDGYVYSLDADTGGLNWRYRTGTAVDSSPCVGADGTIYAGSGDGWFYALNADGTLKWRHYGGAAFDSSAAIGSDGTVYVGLGHGFDFGLLYALDPDDGEVKWEFDANGEVRSSPAIGGDGTIYIGSGDGSVYAINPNGTQRWSYYTGAPIFASPSIASDGTVYIGSFNGCLYAFKDIDSSDTTPPPVPVVTDEGAFTFSKNTLTASWSSWDPESGIASSQYAVGSTPGATNVVGWTSISGATSTTVSGLSLKAGQKLYFSVKSRNGAGLWSPVGSSDGITVVNPVDVMKIGPAKALPNGVTVCIEDVVVTASFADCFYIQESDRSAGIKVLAQGIAAPEVGREVTLVGLLTTTGRERALSPLSLAAGPATALPRGIAVPNQWLGWTPLGEDAVPGGLCNLGMLVVACGRVLSVTPDSFIIDDGTRSASDVEVGLKVAVPPAAVGQLDKLPQPETWVRVEGIICCEPNGSGEHHRVLRPRGLPDIHPLQ